MSKTLGIGKASLGTVEGRRRERRRVAANSGGGGSTTFQDNAPEQNTRGINKRTLAEWDKDDGYYAPFHTAQSKYTQEFKDWMSKMESIGTDYDKSHRKMAEDLDFYSKLAIYNYTVNAAKFNSPLFKGSNDFSGYFNQPSFLNNDPKSYPNGYMGIKLTGLEAKKIERALSKSFKYELDRGITVARGVDMHRVPSVGQITQNKIYTSTAYAGEDWATTGSKPIRYIIRIPKGTRVLHASGKFGKSDNYLSSLGKSEAEILLRKNAVFKTTKVEQVGYVTNVYQDFLGYGSVKKMSKRQLKG